MVNKRRRSNVLFMIVRISLVFFGFMFLNLDRLVVDADYQKTHPFFRRLRLLRLRLRPTRRTCITWVNGIGHRQEHMEEGKEYISKCFGGHDVIYCYNPTCMKHDEDIIGYVSDLTQAGTQKLGYITDEVNSLVQHLKQAIEQVGSSPYGRVIHIAHSQGALITYLATKMLTLKEMNQMEVLCFGGAAVLRKTPQTPFRRCMNYYSVNDPLLMVVPEATQALRSGFFSFAPTTTTTTTRTSFGSGSSLDGGNDMDNIDIHDANDDDRNNPSTTTSSSSYNHEFCFLSPRVGDPIIDHGLIEPTYGQALEWEGARYQRLYISPIERTIRRWWLVVSVLIETIRLYLQELIGQRIVRPILIWCILVYLWTKHTTQQLVQFVRRTIAKKTLRSSF